MTRALYLGGFGNGDWCAERAREGLGDYFDQADAVTLSQFRHWTRRQKEVMTREATLVTASAGALALADVDVSPIRAILLNPPLERTIPRLVAASVVKQARMSTPGVSVRSVGDIGTALLYSASSLAELVAHPIDNFSRLREISQFDAVDTAAGAIERGIPTEIFWTENDAYYKPSVHDQARAIALQVPFTILPGEHDEVVLRPAQHLARVFGAA